MREHIISTQKLKAYQLSTLIIWLAILGVLITLTIITFSSNTTDFFHIYWIFYWGFGFYALFIKRTMKLKSVSYDDENIYIIENDQEIIIPFTEIQYIKLRTALGLHSIHLYQDLGFGKLFYFKSSLWYPFNFKRVDDQVFELQKLIDNAKANFKPENYQALGS